MTSILQAMGFISTFITLAFFGFLLLLGSAPWFGAGLLAAAGLIWKHNPSDDTLWGWMFLLALIGIATGAAGPEYAGSLQH